MKEKTRQDKRRPQKMRDNHKREWFATVEKESGGPTGYIKPRFQVPHPSLIPPQKYLEIAVDNPGELHINYARWVRDLETAHQEWEARRLREGRHLHGTNFDPNAKPTRELVEAMGPKPMPLAPVKAMQQGNKWALGLSEVMPPEARTFFPEPVKAADIPVFSGETWSDPVLDPQDTLATAMAQLEAECPDTLKGAARSAWILKEMKQRVTQVEA